MLLGSQRSPCLRNSSFSMRCRARKFDVRRMMAMLRLPLEDIVAAFVMPSHLIPSIAAATLRWVHNARKRGCT